MAEMSNQNIPEIMTNKENKFIYFYRSSSLTPQEFQKVEEYASKIQNGMKVVPYKIDLDKYSNDLAQFLKERNPKTAE